MACSCTCKKCGLKFDRYSGKLLNISNYMMSLLRDKVESEKHYVLCSDCIEELIGKPITMNMLKFQKLEEVKSGIHRIYFISIGKL